MDANIFLGVLAKPVDSVMKGTKAIPVMSVMNGRVRRLGVLNHVPVEHYKFAWSESEEAETEWVNCEVFNYLYTADTTHILHGMSVVHRFDAFNKNPKVYTIRAVIDDKSVLVNVREDVWQIYNFKDILLTIDQKFMSVDLYKEYKGVI